MLKRIRAVCLPWIYNRICQRYFFLYFVVIGDQDSHAKAFCQFCLFHGCNPVVTGQNGINSFFGCITDQVLIDAIAVFHTIRNLHIHICMAAAQSFQKNIRSTDTINVIIADDADFFLFFYFSHQNSHQFINIL